MFRLILGFLLSGLLGSSYGQVKLNPGVDTSSVAHREILQFWEDYYASRPSKNSTDYLEFWSDEDKALFPQPDLTLHAINSDHSTLFMGYPTVLSILPYGKGYFEIKTAIGWGDTASRHVNLLAIVNHYVKEIDGGYQLCSPLRANDEIKITTRKEYEVYSLEDRPDLDKNLEQLSSYLEQLKSDYDIADSKKITIIYGNNVRETSRLLGFDFNLMSSTNNTSSGRADLDNNLLILSGSGSLFHEAAHLYLNPLFPTSPLLEGLATFHGGSMGKSWAEGASFLHQHIQTEPQINLYEKLQGREFYINNEYNPLYIVQGLLIQIAYDRGGTEEIRKLMGFTDLEGAFEGYFKLTDDETINAFLKKELAARSEEPEPLHFADPSIKNR